MTGDVTDNRNQNGDAIPAYPHGRGNSAEKRDERQRIAHQRVDRPAQCHCEADRCQADCIVFNGGTHVSPKDYTD